MGPQAETAAAYDKVGETARHPGNAQMAVAIMRRLGYTAEHIAMAGSEDVSRIA